MGAVRCVSNDVYFARPSAGSRGSCVIFGWVFLGNRCLHGWFRAWTAVMIALAGEPSVAPCAEHACAFGVSMHPVFELTLALAVKLPVVPEWLVFRRSDPLCRRCHQCLYVGDCVGLEDGMPVLLRPRRMPVAGWWC